MRSKPYSKSFHWSSDIWNYKNRKFVEIISNAANNNKLVVFLGAGISRLCGFPSWDQLSDDLLKFCTSIRSCKFNFELCENIKSRFKDAKQKITIGYHLLEKANKLKQLDKFLVNEFKETSKNKANIVKIKKALKLLNATIITTNYDTYLDDLYTNGGIYCSKDDIQKISLKDEKAIWHIHGSIDKPEDMVLTVRDYLLLYTSHTFRNNMHNVFNSDYVFLFVGYGLSEFQLLDFLVDKDDKYKSRSGEEFLNNKFALIETYLSGEETFRSFAPYYGDYGIRPIAYCFQQNGWETLIDVLNKLGNKISSAGFNPLKEFCHLRDLIRQKAKIEKEQLDFILVDRNKKRSNETLQYIKNNIKDVKTVAEIFCSILKDRNDFFDKKSLFAAKKNEIAWERFDLLVQVASESGNEILAKKCCEILNMILKNPELEKKISFISNTFLMEFVFSMPKYLESDKGHNLVSLYSEHYGNTSWFQFAVKNRSEFVDISYEWVKKYLDLFFSDRKLNFYDFSFYDLDNFFGNVLIDISAKYPNQIFLYAIDKIRSCSDKDKNFFFECMNPAEEILKFREGTRSLGNYLIRLICLSIKGINDAQFVLTSFKELVGSEPIFRKIAIYIASEKYDLLHELLFSRIDSFSSRWYFSEIYCLLKKHVLDLSELECKKIFGFVSKINYQHDLVTKTAKMDICLLMQNNQHNGIDFSNLYSEINLSLSDFEREAIKNFPKPEFLGAGSISGMDAFRNPNKKFGFEIDDLNSLKSAIQSKMTFCYFDYDSFSKSDIEQTINYFAEEHPQGETAVDAFSILILSLRRLKACSFSVLKQLLDVVLSNYNGQDLFKLIDNIFSSAFNLYWDQNDPDDPYSYIGICKSSYGIAERYLQYISNEGNFHIDEGFGYFTRSPLNAVGNFVLCCSDSEAKSKFLSTVMDYFLKGNVDALLFASYYGFYLYEDYSDYYKSSVNNLSLKIGNSFPCFDVISHSRYSTGFCKFLFDKGLLIKLVDYGMATRPKEFEGSIRSWFLQQAINDFVDGNIDEEELNVFIKSISAPFIPNAIKSKFTDFSKTQRKRIFEVLKIIVDKYKREYHGIDVSQFNGTIDWNSVKNSGIDYVYIRVGYRGYGQAGNFREDSKFRTNIEGAKNAGIPVGVYFVTQAITPEEAIEEANWVYNIIKDYKIDYPVALDIEEANVEPGDIPRTINLDNATRTYLAKLFCQTIQNYGYTPIIYTNLNWANNKLNMSELSEFDTWIARYRDINLGPGYDGDYTMWQYTSQGSISGISGYVDFNICYKTY